MDHSVVSAQIVNGLRLPLFYTTDNMVGTFTGEIGDASCGNGGALCSICYKQRVGSQCMPNLAFQVNGNYVANSNSDPTLLLFDGHAGFDYAFPVGTPIYATADGVLSMPTSDPIDGNGCASPCTPQDGFNPLRIDHGYGYETWYLHVLKGSEIVTPGQSVTVTRGQRIASVGSSGTTFYHLHLEVRKNGVPVDAYGWKGQTTDPYLMWTAGLPDKVSATNMNLWNKPPGVPDPQVRWHPDGSLLTDGTTNWLIENGKRRRIPSTQVFNAYGFDLHKVIQASSGELAGYIIDTDFGLPPANRLEQGSTGIYLITDRGFKRLFASTTVFNGLGYKASDVIQVSDAALAAIPNDPASPVLYSPYPDGTLLSSSGSLYVITDGARKQIQSSAVFAALGYYADNVGQAPPEVFSIITASDVGACNGSNSSLTPSSASLPATANGGQLTLITAQSGCTWNVTGIPSWMTITAGLAGQGGYAITFQATANAGASRSAMLTIAGQTFTVTQAGQGGGTAPTADSVSPASGSGLSQSFTFSYSSGNGFGYLNQVYALFNTAVNGASACFAFYDKPSNGLYLYNDTGSAVLGPLAPGAGTTLSNSQCTLTGTGSSLSGVGNTLTMVLNLTFKSSFAGARTTFMYAADSGGFSSGWQNRGTWTVPGGNTPPTADSVTPSSGNSLSQSFTFNYSSGNGFAYLNQVYALFNTAVNGASACFAFYDRPSNGFYLYNDTGTGVFGPMAPGAATTLSNSQCTLSGTGSSVSGLANTLTMVLNLTFKSAFAGAKTTFMYAADIGGMASGWQSRGTWTVPAGNTPPTADSVSPASGSGLTRSFTFNYSSGNGFAYLNQVYALFNTAVNGAGACFPFYDKSSNGFYLYNDAGTGLFGPLAPGAASTLSNSQCTLSGTGSSVSGLGNTLTMVLNLTFKSSFAGAKTTFMYAADIGGMASGWQNRGTWTVPGGNTPPTADSVSPASGNGLTQTFTFNYSSGNRFAYLNQVYALFNSTLNGANGCLPLYDKPSNSFYLYNDAATAVLGPLAPGSAATISNSQCILSGAGSSVGGLANTLTMVLNLTFKSSFAGAKITYMDAADNGGLVSGWQNRGSWTVPGGSTGPTADSVTPASGSGLSQSFAFNYSSSNGFAYLNQVYALFNSALNGANGCLPLYDAPSNSFYLYNDAATATLGPLASGSAATLSNSQCTLSGMGSSVSGSGNILTMTLNLSFTNSFAGTQTIFMAAGDKGGLSSGWSSRGTWTVP